MMKNSEVFLWFVMKMSDGTPTTVPLCWEKSPTRKGSLDCHKLFITRITGRRPRFASNACSFLHSSPVQFESCVICTLTDIRATLQQVTEIHPDLQVISKVFCDTRI